MLSSRVHGSDQLFLVLVEDGPPLLLGLEIDEVLGVEEAGGVGAVVGAAGLADDLGDLGECVEADARLIHDTQALGGAGGGGERSAHPDGALVEVRQKFRADGAAECEEGGEGQRKHGQADCDEAVLNGPFDGCAVAAGEPDHGRVLPLAGAIFEEEAGEDGRDQHGEDQAADQREGHHPGHGLEEAAFDGLQGEDGQVGGDDHSAREEDRALHLVRGLADLLGRRGAFPASVAEMADDVLDHHHGAVHHHSEVERAQREQVGGDAAQVQADGRKEQGEGHGEGDNDGAADVAEEEKQNDDDEEDALAEVVEDGVRGVVEQVAAVEEGNDLDAGGKHAGVRRVAVQLGDFFVDAFQRGVGVVALMQQDDAFDNVGVVDELAVLLLDGDGPGLVVPLLDAWVGTRGGIGFVDGGRADAAGLADLAEADFGPLHNGCNVPDAQRRAALGFEDGLLDVVDAGEEADLADVDLLLALLDEVAAGVDVVVGDLLLHLGDGEAVGDELAGIEADLVLARDAAEAGDIHHAGDGLELLLQLPVFQRLQLHAVVGGIGGAQGVPVDLADGAPICAHLRLEARGQRHLAEALVGLLAIVLVGGVVVEDQHDAGESGERGGTQMLQVGNAGHLDFDGDGDLLLNLFGGAARPLRDDLDVVVGDVGIGLDGQAVEGDDAPGKEQNRGSDHEPAIVQGEIDEAADHLLVHRIL